MEIYTSAERLIPYMLFKIIFVFKSISYFKWCFPFKRFGFISLIKRVPYITASILFILTDHDGIDENAKYDWDFD